MNTNIIIGLLVALVIICVTTIINNLISKEYKTLKLKWNNRATILSDMIWYSGNVNKYIDKLLHSKLDEDIKKNLSYIKNYINSMVCKVKSYETEQF